MAIKTLVFSMALILSLAAGSEAAENSIKGRLGITGRIGFIVPADSDAVGTGVVIGRGHTDVGFIGGGGLMYGITDAIAAELDITHASFGTDNGPDFDTTNISFGAQYRFVNLSLKQLVPYFGGGLDVLVNGTNNGQDVDTVVGGHVTAGVDYFLMKQFALTSEIKGVIAPDADITRPGTGKVGEFDPNNFSMTFGARYFF